MDIKRLFLVMFLILAIARVSDASSGLKLRVLMVEGKDEEKPNSDMVSPSPTPISSPNEASEESSQKLPAKQQQPPPASNKSDLKSPMDKTQVERCDASVAKCQANEDLVACLQHPENDSKKLVLLVQNAGENALSVNIIVPTSITIGAKMLNLAKHSAEKVNLSGDATNNLKIVLNAGKSNCVLQIGPSISDWNRFQLPAYATQVTPMYGAYFLFFALVIAGGAWACCKFGKRGRRADSGVPYQQLEMGAQPPQPTSANVEASTADGWDQGWDDNWDEEEAAARRSDKSPTGIVSSNGLALRSPNKKNGWDIDWDD